MKLEINDRGKNGYFTKCEIKQHTSEQPMGQKEKKKIEREIKKCLETNKNGSITYQKLWVPAKAVQKEAYSDKGLY